MERQTEALRTETCQSNASLLHVSCYKGKRYIRRIRRLKFCPRLSGYKKKRGTLPLKKNIWLWIIHKSQTWFNRCLNFCSPFRKRLYPNGVAVSPCCRLYVPCHRKRAFFFYCYWKTFLAGVKKNPKKPKRNGKLPKSRYANCASDAKALPILQINRPLYGINQPAWMWALLRVWRQRIFSCCCFYLFRKKITFTPVVISWALMWLKKMHLIHVRIVSLFIE